MPIIHSSQGETNRFLLFALAVGLLVTAFKVQAIPPNMPQQNQMQQMPMNQGAPQGGPAPQTVSTTDTTVQKAAKYAANELKSGSVSKVLSAQKQGKDGEIYVMKVQMTNGKVYQVEVCAPTDKPWKIQNSQQLK